MALICQPRHAYSPCGRRPRQGDSFSSAWACPPGRAHTAGRYRRLGRPAAAGLGGRRDRPPGRCGPGPGRALAPVHEVRRSPSQRWDIVPGERSLRLPGGEHRDGNRHLPRIPASVTCRRLAARITGSLRRAEVQQQKSGSGRGRPDSDARKCPKTRFDETSSNQAAKMAKSWWQAVTNHDANQLSDGNPDSAIDAHYGFFGPVGC